MKIFQNLDLLSVGIAIAGILLLGFVIFLNNKKSISNKTFFLFTIITGIWGVVNYLYYQFNSEILSLWLLRLVLFFAVWQAFTLFQLFYIFPKEKKILPKYYKFLLLPLVIIVSLITLSPFVFSEIQKFIAGQAATAKVEPGILAFGITSVGLVISAVVILLKKLKRSSGIEKLQFRYILFGTILMFLSIIIFNFILPAFFENLAFIPLGAVFIFPFIAFTSYAILKHHLLGVKVIATEILTFVLAVVTFAEVIFSEDIGSTIFRSGVFLLVLSFGILLIRSVRKEVEQRERLQVLTTELSAANKRLKKLDQEKDEFLSFASHDLKSPVNKMKQWASLILDGTYKKPEQINDTVFKIKTTGDRAIRLVDEFLNIRKIEEGRMEYNWEEKNIVQFAKEVVDDFTPLAKQRGLELSFEAKIPEIKISLDAIKMRQVIENLIDNSIKYTDPSEQGGKKWIKVRVTEEQKTALITVQDNGGGIDPEILPTLFNQFRREPGVAKKIQGTGLGLFIARQIVLAHQGEIWAESEGRGKGSTFFVRVPKL